MSTTTQRSHDHEKELVRDTIIVGAGFSGLAALYLLRRAGNDAVIIEASDDVGGTWNANRYPGVRTDCESHYYNLTVSQEVIDTWNWTEKYPTGSEVHDYLRHFTTTLKLWPHITLDARVQSMTWDEDSALWDLTLTDGARLRARRVITGTGLLSAPIYPTIPGLADFQGTLAHTSRWPKTGIDFTGMKVGVIGVGSSGVQLIPQIAADCAQLTVFQRTANYVVPARNEALGESEQQDIRDHQHEYHARAKAHPFGVVADAPAGVFADLDDTVKRQVLEARWPLGGFHFSTETFADLSMSDEAAWYASHFVHDKIRDIVTDPAVAELLVPSGYPIGAKRVSTGIDFYETFNRDNVELLSVADTPISAVDATGVWVGGRHIDLDILICATGFNALTGALDAIEIRGRNGELLAQHWREEGLNTYLGITVSGFPNFFMMLGPHTPAGNLPVTIQAQAEWLTELFTWADDEQHMPVIESAEADDEAWARESAQAVSNTVMERHSGGARAWFYGGNVEGKRIEVNTYFGGVPNYINALEASARSGYTPLLAANRDEAIA